MDLGKRPRSLSLGSDAKCALLKRKNVGRASRETWRTGARYPFRIVALENKKLLSQAKALQVSCEWTLKIEPGLLKIQASSFWFKP
ncbi:hypothetical protein SAMN04515695_5598 [Pseudovibrio sp. Tun.PSC04-5.I4]|nr:hypothetical protein SAMN04515695_5598 [Pseudovibrio sp. Tun.PSC04-5.I4]